MPQFNIRAFMSRALNCSKIFFLKNRDKKILHYFLKNDNKSLRVTVKKFVLIRTPSDSVAFFPQGSGDIRIVIGWRQRLTLQTMRCFVPSFFTAVYVGAWAIFFLGTIIKKEQIL